MRRAGLLMLLVAALYSIPLVSAPYVLHILVLCCLYAIPAVGLNLMLGYTGLVSLGHIAFAGIGAYTAAYLMVDLKLGYWSALALAVAASGVAGAVIGAICLRFRSHFFMIVTLAFGLMLYSVMNNWDEVTRGAAGFPGIPRPAGFGPLESFYRLALGGALVAFAVQWLVVRSSFGRILVALRQDERLAEAKGVNAALCKTAVFALGSALAGLGGVLLVSFLRVAAPASFNLAESINAVLIVIIGGAGSLAGPILGALLFVGLPELLRVAAEWRLVVFGAILVLITLFAPNGIADLIARGWNRLGR
ncbi:MAG TPA: branched-chain amino acid ABC transporter permease [Burkholderiales bacterium]|jgi:branched-chain amino acid transport system permease protein|nr:branched-chain amino acid ABC transporter permease [Burkholderiales bacterium]